MVGARFLGEVGWREIGARLRGAHPAWLGAAVGFNLLQLWVWGFRWKLAIRRVDPTPRRLVIYTALAAAAAVNHVAPFARLLGRRGAAGARRPAHGVGVLRRGARQLSHLAVMWSCTPLVAGALLIHNYVSRPAWRRGRGGPGRRGHGVGR